MPETIVELTSPVQEKFSEELLDTRADFMTFGGALILSVTIILSIFFILSLYIPALDGLQMTIVAILTVASWFYLINRFSERLRLDNGTLVFNSALGRKHKYNLHDISALRLNDMGWTLSGDFYILEIQIFDHDKTIELGLGPCWRRKHLTAFLKSVGRILNDYKE